MGNGQVLAQALLSSQSIPYLPLTLVVKGLLVYLLLRNGAYGGTLTPSFALGIGSWLSSDLAFDSPWDSSGSSYRDVTRSDSLLGTTLEAPLTAIALSLGFTGQT